MSKAPKYWNAAKIKLAKKDPVLRKVIKKFNTGFLKSKKIPFFLFAEQSLDSKYL